MTRAPGANLTVGINAALDPAAAGGVQTNLVALVDTLPGHLDGIRPTLLVPASVEAAWRARAQQDFAVARWPHELAWYREPSAQTFKQRLRASLTLPALRASRRHDRTLRALGIDVVHFPYQLAFRTSLPFIYEPWDFQHVHLPEFFSPGERAWRDEMYGRACRNSRLVVTATIASKRDVMAQYDVAPEKIAVIYRDSTMAKSEPPRHECALAAAAMGLPSRFAFYPAQAYPHKNHMNLFEALALLRAEAGIIVPLVCSGRDSASHTPKLKAAVARLGLTSQVHFLGAVSEAELTALYRSATLLIFPSLFEGLGLPLLEAMYHDLPIAASATSCIPEVVGEAGVLFDPRQPPAIAAALRQIWESPDRAAALIARGRERRALFQWDTAARTMAAAYRYAGGRALSADEEASLNHARAL